MVLTIVLTVILFAIVIFVHELGHFLAAKASKIQVNEFSIGMGPSLFQREKNGTIYSLRAFPIGGYVQMEGEDEDSDSEHSFNNAHILKRIAVILAGAIMNFVLGVVLMGIIVGTQSQVAVPIVGNVTEGYEQESAFKAGDRLLSINGSRIVNAQDVTFQLSRIDESEPINVTVKRDGEKITLKDAAFEITNEDGSTNQILGISLETQDLNIRNFFSTTFGNSVFYGKLVWTSLGDLVTGRVSVSQVSGPIGVGQAVNEAQSYGFLSVLSLFTLITINLGIFNLLPFPALDGGRFVFLLYELIARRRVNPKIERYVNAAGLAILMVIMLGITVKDIFQLF